MTTDGLVSLSDSCIRHLAIFGLKWPARTGAVLAEFGELHDTDSDAEESSSVESGVEIVSTNPTIARNVPARRASRSERSTRGSGTIWPIVHGQNQNISAFLHAKKRPSSFSDKVKSLVQSYSTDRATRTKKREEGSLVESKLPTLSTHPTQPQINRKVPAPISSGSRSASTSSKAQAPPPKKRKVVPLQFSPGLVNKAQLALRANTVTAKSLTRDARARTRELIRENPELDKSEAKLMANAGVLRSGRPRASLPTKVDDALGKGKKRVREATSEEDLPNEDEDAEKGRSFSLEPMNRRPLPLFCHGPNPSYFALRRRRLPDLISHDSDDERQLRRSQSREAVGDDTQLNGSCEIMTIRSRSSSLSPPPSETEQAPPRSSFTLHSDMEIDELFCPDPTQIVNSSTPFFVPDRTVSPTDPSLFQKMDVDRDDSELTLVADGGSSDQNGSTSPPSQSLDFSRTSPANSDGLADFSSPPSKRQIRTYQNSKRSFVTRDSPGAQSPIIGHLSVIVSLADVKEKAETVQPEDG